MSAHPCDQCGATPAALSVASRRGLAAWHRLHPDAPRRRLWFCSVGCVLLQGLELGRLATGGSPRRWTGRALATLVAAREAGATLEDLATQHGVTRCRIWQVLRHAGATTTRHPDA